MRTLPSRQSSLNAQNESVVLVGEAKVLAPGEAEGSSSADSVRRRELSYPERGSLWLDAAYAVSSLSPGNHMLAHGAAKW